MKHKVMKIMMVGMLMIGSYSKEIIAIESYDQTNQKIVQNSSKGDSSSTKELFVGVMVSALGFTILNRRKHKEERIKK